MYGKKYIGVDRSTFLVNAKGIIVSGDPLRLKDMLMKFGSFRGL